ncbi:energy transducer TonB [Elizabethkingia anophelis]|nr:energy transducer TonB [Elizabethkingia anophelis]
MRKLLIFALMGPLFFSQEKFNNDQAINYEQYTKGHDDYYGGNLQFYKDIHQIIVDKKLQPCENKNALYYQYILVYPDATIKLIDRENFEQIEQDKCVYDLTRELFKYLKGWKPAEKDGKKYTAQTAKIIFPDALFDKYKDGYDSDKYIKTAKFEYGLTYLYTSIQDRLSDIRKLGKMNNRGKAFVKLIISKNGDLEDIYLTESSLENKKVEEEIVNNIKAIEGSWKPTTIHGIPIRSRLRIPVSFKGGW